MISLKKLPPNDAYLAHLGHLYACQPCATRSGTPCATGKALRRALNSSRSSARSMAGRSR